MINLFRHIKSESFFGNPFSADKLFCGISPKTQKYLEKIKKRVKFDKNETIFSVGEFPSAVYVLIEGNAQMFIASECGNRRIIRSIFESELLGLPESLSCFPYETGIETLSICRCDCFPREDFIDFLKNDSQTGFRLLKMLGQNLQNSYHAFSASKI